MPSRRGGGESRERVNRNLSLLFFHPRLHLRNPSIRVLRSSSWSHTKCAETINAWTWTHLVARLTLAAVSSDWHERLNGRVKNHPGKEKKKNLHPFWSLFFFTRHPGSQTTQTDRQTDTGTDGFWGTRNLPGEDSLKSLDTLNSFTWVRGVKRGGSRTVALEFRAGDDN